MEILNYIFDESVLSRAEFIDFSTIKFSEDYKHPAIKGIIENYIRTKMPISEEYKPQVKGGVFREQLRHNIIGEYKKSIRKEDTANKEAAYDNSPRGLFKFLDLIDQEYSTRLLQATTAVVKECSDLEDAVKKFQPEPTGENAAEKYHHRREEEES